MSDTPDVSVFLTAVKADDVGAFEQVVRLYETFAFAFAMTLLNDEEVVGIVAAEAFARLWELRKDMDVDRFDPRAFLEQTITDLHWQFMEHMMIEIIADSNNNQLNDNLCP
jgi:hypothetical protein